jgi:superfamily II DNA/RNA helicase
MGKVKYMVVTDVAARGIDVPLLDFVINYSFPPAAKLFVHRVRRDTTAFGTQQNDSHLRSPQHLTASGSRKRHLTHTAWLVFLC